MCRQYFNILFDRGKSDQWKHLRSKDIGKSIFSKVRRSLHHAHSTMNSLLSLCDC